MRLLRFCLTTILFTSCVSETRNFGRDDTSGDSAGAGILSSGVTDSWSSDGSTSGQDSAGRTEDCAGCFIEDRCFALNTRHPDNECQVCKPGVLRAGWTADDGHACDDGLFCTLGDACVEGECVAQQRECEDGVACNGTSECDEEADQCTKPGTTCPGSYCDLDLDECVTACEGCIIEAQCVPAGSVSSDNTCLVCDPASDSENYSAAIGKSCGSEQAGPCDAADTCDVNGRCLPNEVADGEPCEDELYCSEQSQCLAGECTTTIARECPTGNLCDEDMDACVCDGCLVDGVCYETSTQRPDNPCYVCLPEVDREAFSPYEGAPCGDVATECSLQDSCDGSGNCLPNHLEDGSECPTGECNQGQCAPLENPFDCIAPDPPPVSLPPDVLSASGVAPVGQGGTILDGRYVPVRIDIYGMSITSANVRTFEFRRNFVQVGQQPYLLSGAGAIPQFEFTGTFATMGAQIDFMVQRCDPQLEVDIPSLTYTASANGLMVIDAVTYDGVPGAVVTSYSRVD